MLIPRKKFTPLVLLLLSLQLNFARASSFELIESPLAEKILTSRAGLRLIRSLFPDLEWEARGNAELLEKFKVRIREPEYSGTRHYLETEIQDQAMTLERMRASRGVRSQDPLAVMGEDEAKLIAESAEVRIAKLEARTAGLEVAALADEPVALSRGSLTKQEFEGAIAAREPQIPEGEIGAAAEGKAKFQAKRFLTEMNQCMATQTSSQRRSTNFKLQMESLALSESTNVYFYLQKAGFKITDSKDLPKEMLTTAFWSLLGNWITLADRSAIGVKWLQFVLGGTYMGRTIRNIGFGYGRTVFTYYQYQKYPARDTEGIDPTVWNERRYAFGRGYNLINPWYSVGMGWFTQGLDCLYPSAKFKAVRRFGIRAGMSAFNTFTYWTLLREYEHLADR